MATDAQLDANRRNAEYSTGPKTEEGKAASSMNALKHGLSAMRPVLPTEDEEEFARFRDALRDDLAPEGALEERLAEEIIDLCWRLRRASNLEYGVLADGVASVDSTFYLGKRREFETTERDVTEKSRAIDLGLDDEVIQILNSDVHEYLSEEADEAAMVKRTGVGRLGQAFRDDAAGPNAITKLARHETALFRRRNQALDVLAAAQNARATASRTETT